jgi:CHAT domain-containing protein/Tfp pilus assembly protein PilF
LLLLPLALLISACDAGREGDLEVGEPIEREIGGGEVHSYRLPIEAGSYISIRIEQPGTDIKARLEGPDGVSVPVFDDRGKGAEDGPDRLAWIAKTPGEYRLAVRARDAKAPRGHYRVELWELRRARPEDADRLAAEREYQEGLRLLWKKEQEDVAAKCLAHFQTARQLWRRRGDKPGQVDALVPIAEIQNIQGRPEEAVLLGEEAMKLARAARYRAGEARALQALGHAHSWLSEWPQAIGAFRQSLRLWQELHHEGRQGTVLYTLGNSYQRQSQFDQAFEAWRRARSLLGAAGDAAVIGKTLVSIANAQMSLGETAQALETCTQALGVGRTAREASVEAAALYCLGGARVQRGELATARKLFEESLAINIRLGNRANQAFVHQALGSVYFNLGDPDRTLLEYEEGLTLCRNTDNQDLEARLLTNIGWIFQAKGDPKRALAYYEKALPLHKAVDNDSGVALTLHNIGVAYTTSGMPRQGLPYLRNALELRTQIEERSAQAGTLLEIGTTYKTLGELRRTADYYRLALDLARKVENSKLEAEGLFRWASLDTEEGRFQEALDKIERSLNVIEAVRSEVSSDKLRTSFFASKRGHYELYIDLLMELEALHPGQYRAAALEASERARARGLLDLLTEGHIDLQEGIAPSLRQREIELGVRLSALQNRLGRLPAGQAEAAALERHLDRVEAEMEKLESQIRRHHQRYAEVLYPTPLRVGEIQGLLDDRTALVQYFTAQRSSFVFVVTRESVESHRLPARETLTKEVTSLLQLLRNRVGRRQLHRYQTLAAQLYTQLLGPAEGILKEKGHLLISPDGPLHLLPFEALLIAGDAARDRTLGELPYVLRRFTISYIPSISVLRGLRAARSEALGPRHPPKSFLAFADPNYGGANPSGEASRSASLDLVRLPQSEEEVRRIASLYPSNSVALYVGALATEENVKRNEWLAEARQIHFATHGNLNESRPQLSGLELARSSRSKEDGTLRVYEIFNLRLNADLLALSACDTARGQEVSGEGIIGITRAFFYAGAKSLVVSLWPVSDRSTPDLMFDFYRQLGDSQKKAEALRHAKLAMIASEDYADPYFWAPFILSGVPE